MDEYYNISIKKDRLCIKKCEKSVPDENEENLSITWCVKEKASCAEKIEIAEDTEKRWEKAYFSWDTGDIEIPNVSCAEGQIFILKEKEYPSIYFISNAEDTIEKVVETEGVFTISFLLCKNDRLYFSLEIYVKNNREKALLICTDLQYVPLWGYYLDNYRVEKVINVKEKGLLFQFLSWTRQGIEKLFSRKLCFMKDECIEWSKEVFRSIDNLSWIRLEEDSFYYVESDRVRRYSYTGQLLYEKELEIYIEFYEEIGEGYQAIAQNIIEREQACSGYHVIRDKKDMLVSFTDMLSENYKILRVFDRPVCNWLGTYEGTYYWFEIPPEGGSRFMSSASPKILNQFNAIFNSTYDFLSPVIDGAYFYIFWNKETGKRTIIDNGFVLCVNLQGEIIQEIDLGKRNFIKGYQLVNGKKYIYTVKELPYKNWKSIYDDFYQWIVQCYE